MNHSIRLSLSLAIALGAAPLFAAPQEPAPAGGLETAAPAEAAAEPEITMIRMRDGSIYWGSIVDDTPDTVTFQRLDTGGLVTLPWAFLDAEQEYELRLRFGYIEVGGEEIMVPAEMLITVDGQEIVGIILGRTEDAIQIKSGGRMLNVPKARVRNHVAGLQVPALEIYTKDDLYASELQKIDPEDPQAHFELAEFCERILDFSRALEHYRTAAELDPEFKAKELAVIQGRVSEKVEQQEQIDALAEIDHWNRRKKFQRALDDLALFDATYPDSPLEADRLKLEKRVLEARDKYLHVEVAKQWFNWMGKLAGRAARESTFEQTLSYLEEGFSQEIVTNVAESMRGVWPEMEEDQVRQFFAERKRGRWKPASYGLGTWLLGEEDALKGLDGTETPEEKPTSPRDAKREQMEKQIQRFLKNQAMAKRARRSEDEEDEVEDAWKLLSSPARRNWIVAYYAENSGELDLRPKPELQNCSECGGTGVREIIYTGSAREGATSGVAKVPCPTCHGIGRVRRIRYR